MNWNCARVAPVGAPYPSPSVNASIIDIRQCSEEPTSRLNIPEFTPKIATANACSFLGLDGVDITNQCVATSGTCTSWPLAADLYLRSKINVSVAQTGAFSAPLTLEGWRLPIASPELGPRHLGWKKTRVFETACRKPFV
ncbi:hypothetical protein COCOBI_07-0430 [Coccomyxa sp. Obi]|nr:hypothetical protein COCOBI_07-0430 [Coccomyxa sp. Obi]